MATFSSLTTQQQNSIKALGDFVRSQTILLAQLGNHGRAIANTYPGDLEALIASLDTNEQIPNGTNYANALPLVKGELVNLIGYFMTLSDTTDNAVGSYNTNYHRSLYAKAAGINNLIG